MSPKNVAGNRLGAYEVVGLIGAGGMGEVYRARDPRLGRDVAIKTLPASVSDDHDRLRRFEQEAKAASALNHPNILAIYDIGTHDGTPYVVSELLDGETLGRKIDSRALPLRKALDYAIQLAHGLAAAHAKGIVHRDLKPDNVFVTSDGRVKILDFGLAKVAPSAAQDDVDTVAASPETTPGIVVGTVGYMAPEQVRGSAADHRSDIFSFGVVLFEMVTGRRAFARASAADTMAAILTHDPLEPSGAVRALPAVVERLLRHCLEKSPDERFQSARDLSFNLESLWSGVEPLAPMRRALPRPKVVLWTLAGLLAAALIAAGVVRFAPRAAPSVVRFTIAPPRDVQALDYIALSPDGNTLVYAGSDASGTRLYRRRLDTLESVPIRGADGGTRPFFSPDGASVGFSVGGALQWVPLQGGVAVRITETTNPAGGSAAWLPDDTIVLGVEGRGLQRVPLAGGSLQQVTRIDRAAGELEHLWPMPIPGGRFVAFTVHYGARDTQRIHIVNLDTGSRTLLVEGNGARFLPTGHLLFQRNQSLWAASFDAASLAVTSTPTAVLEQVGIAPDWSPNIAVGGQGSLAYMTGNQPYLPRTLVWVDRGGREEPVGVPLRSWFWPQMSADGKRLGFHDMNPVNMDVWIYDLERAALVRMTFDPRQDGYPVWSPDGKHIAFWSRQHGEAANLYVRSADLTGADRRLTTSPNYQLPFSWANNGTLLIFQEFSRDTGMDIGTVALDGKTPPALIIKSAADEEHPAVSPDGRWIAYQSNLSGRPEIYVQPFPGLGGRWQVSTQGGESPVWHPNGRELFYRRNRSMMGIAVDSSPTSFNYGSSKILFEGSYVADERFGRNYTLAPDGRFLMMKEDPAPPPQMVVIMNWAQELQRAPQAR